MRLHDVGKVESIIQAINFLSFSRFFRISIKANHRISNVSVIFSRHFSNDLLFQSRKGSKGIDPAAVKIELPVCDIACVIRNRVRDVAAWHGGN